MKLVRFRLADLSATTESILPGEQAQNGLCVAFLGSDATGAYFWGFSIGQAVDLASRRIIRGVVVALVPIIRLMAE